jgi:dTDP-4-amino-4,6-dideoxygalactose transaminase
LINSPFSPWPSYSQEEADAVSQVLLSNKVNYWTGVEAREFEREFSRWCGVKHSIALANGTVALDLALHALQLSPGDEVVVTPRTFIASVSCVVNAGATPVFADVSAVSGNISAETIAKVLTPRTKAIVCVHLAGYPCDMDPIMALAEKHSLHVIEDCAQANGARYKRRSVGAIGHIGAWSFCQDKIMTTGGEGGMVTTNDELLWRRMWAFKDHGKSYEAVYEREHPPGYRWLHDGFGTNWRMTELQAAIGRLQLRRLPDWTSSRNANAELLSQTLQPLSGKDGPLRMPELLCSNCSGSCGLGLGEGCVHAQYKYYVYLRPENLKPGWSRDRILDEINERGVPCYQGSCSEVYLELAFDGTGWRPEQRLPVAKQLGETSLMFLVHPTLTVGEVEKTAQVAIEVLERAWRTERNKVLAP